MNGSDWNRSYMNFLWILMDNESLDFFLLESMNFQIFFGVILI